jgi:hypothetical protein
MKLYAFEGAETDWVAANSEAEARDTLISHYGISGDDVTGSYESVSEVDPAGVEFYTDEVDAETEKTVMTTAAAMMVGKAAPFVLGSTAWQ